MDDADTTPRVRGRPFQRGFDPRRNEGGRRPDPLSTAIREALTDADLAAIARAVIGRACGGDLDAIRLLFDRVEGKAVSRVEMRREEPRPPNPYMAYSIEELDQIIEKLDQIEALEGQLRGDEPQPTGRLGTRREHRLPAPSRR